MPKIRLLEISGGSFEMGQQHGLAYPDEIRLLAADLVILVHPEDPFFLESCSAAIMRPASREMWAVWGNPCQNQYEHFVV